MNPNSSLPDYIFRVSFSGEHSNRSSTNKALSFSLETINLAYLRTFWTKGSILSTIVDLLVKIKNEFWISYKVALSLLNPVSSIRFVFKNFRNLLKSTRQSLWVWTTSHVYSVSLTILDSNMESFAFEKRSKRDS